MEQASPVKMIQSDFNWDMGYFIVKVSSYDLINNSSHLTLLLSPFVHAVHLSIYVVAALPSLSGTEDTG
jgi:uncharacterized membrane protein (UPF0182 family)